MEVTSPSLLEHLAPPRQNVPFQRMPINSNGEAEFDVNGKYWLKPLFLKALRLVKDVPSNKVVFHYQEVSSCNSK